MRCMLHSLSTVNFRQLKMYYFTSPDYSLSKILGPDNGGSTVILLLHSNFTEASEVF